MNHSGVERELKFGDADHGAVRERLQSLEAECQGPPILEENWLFDREGEITSAGGLLRLRSDKRGAWLTFKGKASFEDRVKVRTEHETLVENLENTRKILESLGYGVIRRYQKYREDWLLGSVCISLDHTPIGDFVEFEGEGCETVARRSGFDLEVAERRNYLRLYEDYLVEHPEAPPDMVFP
jgi:predicted adenylyl cyclase CyaB